MSGVFEGITAECVLCLAWHVSLTLSSTSSFARLRELRECGGAYCCGLLPNLLFLPSSPDNFGQVGRRQGPTRHQSWAVVSAEWAGWRLCWRGRAVVGYELFCDLRLCEEAGGGRSRRRRRWLTLLEAR